MKNYLNIIFIICILNPNLAFGNDGDSLLVKFGDVGITITEFYARAEYTPRPAYCNSDNNIHKKIILNSLIAEKLLAHEAGTDNELTRTVEYKTFIKGRKEQAMRQIHFYEKAYKNAMPDSNAVAVKYALAGRTYNLSFFRIVDSTKAFIIYENINNGIISFDSVYSMIGIGDTIPTKSVSFFSQESPEIISKVFNSSVKKYDFLEPIHVGDSYILLRVDGWHDKVAITKSQKELRWYDVELLMTEKKSMEVYTDYVGKLMQGKKIQFDRNTFKKLVEIVAPFYLKDEKKKEAMFNKSFWRAANKNEVIMSNLNDADFLKESSLLNYDNNVWTIEKLMDEIKVHPLVFRKNELGKKDFAEQFKLAIVDLIRDKEITNDSYKNGYDSHKLVVNNIEMWSGNLLCNYQKFLVLKKENIKEMDKSIVINKILNPYIKKLQKKYSSEIKINVSEFNKVKLSTVDMLGIQTDMAFPFVVPLFPEITTLNKLDYGEVLK